MPIITLTTDFGMQDPDLGVLKSRILQEIPNAQIIDISHDAMPFDLEEAVYIVQNALKDFPAGRFYNHLNYRHLKLISESGDILIISRPMARLQEKMATFSVLFLLMGLMALFIFFIVFNREVFSVFMLSFRTRLQVFFIAAIWQAFVMILCTFKVNRSCSIIFS